MRLAVDTVDKIIEKSTLNNEMAMSLTTGLEIR